MFSSEFSWIFKNTYFVESPWKAASEGKLKHGKEGILSSHILQMFWRKSYTREDSEFADE